MLKVTAQPDCQVSGPRVCCAKMLEACGKPFDNNSSLFSRSHTTTKDMPAHCETNWDTSRFDHCNVHLVFELGGGLGRTKFWPVIIELKHGQHEVHTNLRQLVCPCFLAPCIAGCVNRQGIHVLPQGQTREDMIPYLRRFLSTWQCCIEQGRMVRSPRLKFRTRGRTSLFAKKIQNYGVSSRTSTLHDVSYTYLSIPKALRKFIPLISVALFGPPLPFRAPTLTDEPVWCSQELEDPLHYLKTCLRPSTRSPCPKAL